MYLIGVSYEGQEMSKYSHLYQSYGFSYRFNCVTAATDEAQVGSCSCAPRKLCAGRTGFKSVSELPLPFEDSSIFCFMCMSILPPCIDVYHVCVCCSGRSEEGVGFPRTGVTDDHKPSGGCWEPN